MTAAPFPPTPSDAAGSGRSAARSPQTWVEVDLNAIARNFDRLAERIGGGAQIILSVKKEAYGHGIVEVARALSEHRSLLALGVATLEEADRLRHEGIAGPILNFSILWGEELRAAIGLDVTLTITNLPEAEEASRAAAALGAMAIAHLKVDTGMGRLGRTPDEIEPQLEEIARLPSLKVEAVYSHLADGWNDPESARRQAVVLDRVRSKFGGASVMGHIGGSDALSIVGEFDFQAIRSGIAVYGAHPGIQGLEGAMSFKSQVIFRRRAARGTNISYGGTNTLARDSELAVVGAGYGNGYPVSLSGRGEALIGGIRRPVLGRVCMDQFIVDVTDEPDVALGAEVVMFGRQEGATLDVGEVAERAGTISYELMTVAGRLNPRFYVE